eukprot:CAMPEP_0172536934 /NCGR_PEP_ID=MMETSP1067-20121228/8645_1 /TAXON_ID=265564 ORGANISM="Thalassiosira punctigera, Strain Tpunct2005C2" /NCGR_SAMPLE_ID=MMETSP1067 /ASSEMBLY_ACC=CAM_ASM_000444 /LENGTH=100 /DNA_ID=CAMNT_0013322121 /DNA_START=97 /DNA_END=395 /DNA_ORIENTATION=-
MGQSYRLPCPTHVWTVLGITTSLKLSNPIAIFTCSMNAMTSNMISRLTILCAELNLQRSIPRWDSSDVRPAGPLPVPTVRALRVDMLQRAMSWLPCPPPP